MEANIIKDGKNIFRLNKVKKETNARKLKKIKNIK